MHRVEAIDADELAKAERIAMTALAGGDRLTRKSCSPRSNRAASRRPTSVAITFSSPCRCGLWSARVPVVPRAGGPSREQYIVRTDEWVRDAASPADPLAEFFARYIGSHGPAGVRDFAWWSGLPLGVARQAAEAASDRLTVVADDGEPLYVASAPAPRRSPAAQAVIALPPFEEYYLSYADRTVPCAPEFLAHVGPSLNGIVRPILVAHGQVVGVWTHSVAVGRHADAPVPELFAEGRASASRGCGAEPHWVPRRMPRSARPSTAIAPSSRREGARGTL